MSLTPATLDLLDNTPSNCDFCIDAAIDGDESSFRRLWPQLTETEKASVLTCVWWNYDEHKTPITNNLYIKTTLSNHEKEIDPEGDMSLTNYLFPPS
jgi:hypothetical protein